MLDCQVLCDINSPTAWVEDRRRRRTMIQLSPDCWVIGSLNFLFGEMSQFALCISGVVASAVFCDTGWCNYSPKRRLLWWKVFFHRVSGVCTSQSNQRQTTCLTERILNFKKLIMPNSYAVLFLISTIFIHLFFIVSLIPLYLFTF